MDEDRNKKSGRRRMKVIFTVILLVAPCLSFADETVKMDTYFPSSSAKYETLKLIPTNTTPAPPTQGEVYYSDTPGSAGLYYYDGNSWKLVGAGAGSDSVNSLDAADGNPEDAVYVDNAGLVGIGTKSPAVKLDIYNDGGIIARGTAGSETLSSSGAGTRLIWYPTKSTFCTGGVDGSQWDDANLGSESVAIGYNAQVSGMEKVAVGYNVTSRGAAMGYNVTVGLGGTVMGRNTSSATSASLAMGCDTTANGAYSPSLGMGGNVTASGAYTLAIGYNTTASIPAPLPSPGTRGATAVGNSALADGDAAIAIGSYLTSSALHTIVIGRGVDESNPLVNNVDSSVMIGFNSATPTLFIHDEKIGVGVLDPTSRLDIDSGSPNIYQLRLRNSYAPASTGAAAGNIGNIAWGQDGGTYYFYVKTSVGWKRVALQSHIN